MILLFLCLFFYFFFPVCVLFFLLYPSFLTKATESPLLPRHIFVPVRCSSSSTATRNRLRDSHPPPFALIKIYGQRTIDSAEKDRKTSFCPLPAISRGPAFVFFPLQETFWFSKFCFFFPRPFLDSSNPHFSLSLLHPLPSSQSNSFCLSCVFPRGIVWTVIRRIDRFQRWFPCSVLFFTHTVLRFLLLTVHPLSLYFSSYFFLLDYFLALFTHSFF